MIITYLFFLDPDVFSKSMLNSFQHQQMTNTEIIQRWEQDFDSRVDGLSDAKKQISLKLYFKSYSCLSSSITITLVSKILEFLNSKIYLQF